MFRNDDGTDVQAFVANITEVVSDTGNIEVEATVASLIEATAVAVSIAVSFGGKSSVNLSGGGAESTNTLLRKVLAFITGTNSVTALAGTVEVSATDESTIVANVDAVSLSGTASIGVALARNYIGWEDSDTKGTDQVLAHVDGSTVNTKNLVLLADSRPTITAEVGAGSVGFASTDVLNGTTVAASGAGVEATNKISTDVRAYITTTGSVTAHDNVNIQAVGKSRITADAGAASGDYSDLSFDRSHVHGDLLRRYAMLVHHHGRGRNFCQPAPRGGP